MTAAAFDYSELLATATELIEQFGRSITLTRPSRTPAPAKTWLTQQGAASAAAAQSITTTGVFLDYETANKGQLMAESRSGGAQQTVETKLAVFLVPAEPTLPEEVGPDWKVLEASGREWEITSVEPLQPGPTLLFYTIMVSL